MTSIEKEFVKKGILRGGELMLRPPDSIALVRRCRECGIAVLGVDGFILTARTIQPVMEQSVDLSQPRRAGTRENSWDRAESFIEQRIASDLFFKVVVDEQ